MITSYVDFIKAVQDGEELPDAFKCEHGYYTFIQDYHSLRVLNATLETNYKAVYRVDISMKNNEWSKGNINWDCDNFYIVTAKGVILHHTNSEWGGIERVSL